MLDEQNIRRRFLIAAVTFAGLASAPIPVAVIGSGAAGNPTLTIVALAIHQADYIAEQMRPKKL